VAAPRRKRDNGEGDWLQSLAVAVVTGLIINDLMQKYGPKAKRAPGKVVPSVVPAGLPAFPAGWEPYQNPSSTIVGKRAAALLFQLWRQGEGATITEQTAGLPLGQWVTYQAQVHEEGTAKKKGVGAWRVKAVVHGAVA
jgi:hypothetical protein